MEEAGVRKEREDPTNNIVNISANRKIYSLVDQSKRVLEIFDTVQLHAIGRAMKSLVQTSNLLQGNGYANMKSTELISVELEGREGAKITRPKIIVELAKASGFDTKNKLFNEIKQQNREKYAKNN